MDDHHGKHRSREHTSHRRHHRTVAAGEKAVHGSHYARPEENQASASKSLPVHHILKEKIQEPLAAQEDYVHRWLAGTAEELPEVDSHKPSKQSCTEIPRQSKGTFARRPGFPQFLQNKDQNARGLGMDIDEDYDHRKNGLEMSSESSFLERGHAPEPKIDANHRERGLREDHEVDQENTFAHENRKRKRSPSPASTAHSQTSDHRPKETFERRARHKTKEDRYDPKKNIEKPKRERKPKKNEKKGERSKMMKSAGENLMKNFESKNVGNDRLTMRPSQKLGLFKHGRASSPGRRRGLPDLAFSEMEFLQRSNRGTDQRPGKPHTRTRHKDRRREERVFNEITSYFTAGKEPLTEINPNRQDPQGSRTRGLQDLAYEQPDVRQTTESSLGDTSRRLDSAPDFPDFMGKPFLGFGRQASIPSKERTFVPKTPRRDLSEMATDTASKTSGPPTTYVTWSESAMSPNAGTEPRRREATEQEISSTPESVREAIARTGIFKDTGLRRNLTLHAPEDIRARLWGLQHDDERSSQSSRNAPRLGALDSQQQIPRPPSAAESVSSNESQPDPNANSTKRRVSFDLSRFKADFPGAIIEMSRTPTENMRTSKRKQAEVEVHHFDPEMGWHQGKIDEGQGNVRRSANDPPQTESVRPNRNELAQAAYIRQKSKNASRETHALKIGNDLRRTGFFPQRPDVTIRPVSAPPAPSIPKIARPHSAAVTAGADLPNREVRFPVVLPRREEREEHDIQVAPQEKPQQEAHAQRFTVPSSLPPLTDSVSASSVRRTESASSTKNTRGREHVQMLQDHFPEKSPVGENNSFGLPVRGAWTEETTSSLPVRRLTPAVALSDSLYGQQMDQVDTNSTQNRVSTPVLDDVLLANDRGDLDYAREEAFIQGLMSYQGEGFHDARQYADVENLEPMGQADANVGFADNDEYFQDQQYLGENFQENFEPGEYGETFERQDGVVNQENAFAGNELNEYTNYETGSYQPYQQEGLFRQDVEKAEAEESLVGFWRPFRHY